MRSLLALFFDTVTAFRASWPVNCLELGALSALTGCCVGAPGSGIETRILEAAARARVETPLVLWVGGGVGHGAIKPGRTLT